MNMQEYMKLFTDVDFSTWTILRNRNNNIIWLNQNIDGLKIHINLANEPSVRFYQFKKDEKNVSTERMTITNNYIRFEEMVVHYNEETKKHTSEENIIAYVPKYKEIFSEEQFFQESLVNDYGDLGYNDILVLSDLRDRAVDIAKKELENVGA
ncbi:hypothetical protein SEPL_040 [Salmonella phage SE_PL]|uniref:hypothetical protein n=1 Tax=Salmonella enterica TaxID=28901 RepID=UPI001162BBB4|nr:hypothetical protein 7t3_0573 [Salmonella phage 7t3]QIG62653.1 hypothetical protein SEPL_040 [Salmonella phage SE_PL]